MFAIGHEAMRDLSMSAAVLQTAWLDSTLSGTAAYRIGGAIGSGPSIPTDGWLRITFRLLENFQRVSFSFDNGAAPLEATLPPPNGPVTSVRIALGAFSSPALAPSSFLYDDLVCE